MPPLPYLQVAEPEMASCNENVDEDHSFILRLIIATGDLDCDVNACAFFWYSVCDGLVYLEEGDNGDVLCALRSV